jgi:hypothetical protein
MFPSSRNVSRVRFNKLTAMSAVGNDVSVSGKMLLRKACPEGIDWDETLPDIHKDSWQIWTQYLNSLNGYQIPRMYAPTSLLEILGLMI